MSTQRSSSHHSYSTLTQATALSEDDDYKLAVLLNNLTEKIKNGHTFTDREISKLTKTAFENTSFGSKETLQLILENFLAELNVKINADEGEDEDEEVPISNDQPDPPVESDEDSFMEVLRVAANEEPVGSLRKMTTTDSDLSVKCCCIAVTKFKN